VTVAKARTILSSQSFGLATRRPAGVADLNEHRGLCNGNIAERVQDAHEDQPVLACRVSCQLDEAAAAQTSGRAAPGPGRPATSIRR
jgi:hypothetical protein